MSSKTLWTLVFGGALILVVAGYIAAGYLTEWWSGYAGMLKRGATMRSERQLGQRLGLVTRSRVSNSKPQATQRAGSTASLTPSRRNVRASFSSAPSSSRSEAESSAERSFSVFGGAPASA